MIKSNKIYHIVSISNFILHICVFLFVTLVGFLPFRDDRNFYESFVGFFSETLSTIQPYVLIGILFVSCVGAFLAVKRPLFSLLVLASTLVFFVCAILPYTIDAMVFGLFSSEMIASMSIYKIGFKLINRVSRIVCFDIAFFVYSVITLIIRRKRSS